MIASFIDEYEFLSNFYVTPKPLRLPRTGLVVWTTEHLYQSYKVTDLKLKYAILQAPTPSAAKKLGRSLPLRPDWEDIKDQVMLVCLDLKFNPETQPELVSKLIATAPETLVEGNTWHDQYWGVCNCPKHRSTGENHLGNMLMFVREKLANTTT
jgi:N-glycosidase YbiA